MSLDFQYASLIGALLFGLVWFVLLIARKDTRREMLVMSLLVAPLGPLSEIFYLRDYWHPEILGGLVTGLEDLLFGFFIGGIAAVVYEEVWGKRYAKRRTKNRVRWALGFAMLGLAWMLVGCFILRINSIYASISYFIVVGIIMLAKRRDLFLDALLSGLMLSLLMLVFYVIFGYLFPGVIQKWWLLKNISGVIILGAPLEELLWGFAWGFVAGPAYEFYMGLKFKKGSR